VLAVNPGAVGKSEMPDNPRYTVARIMGGRMHPRGAFILQVQLMRQTDVAAITYRPTPRRTMVPLAKVHPVKATPNPARKWWKLDQGFDVRGKFLDPQAAK